MLVWRSANAIQSRKTPMTESNISSIMNENMTGIVRAVNRGVIGAIIDGTIGHKYHTDFDFRKLFPPTDELTGICLNTLVCARDGKGLTGTEWMEVQAVMQEYVVRFSNIWMRATSLKIYRR